MNNTHLIQRVTEILKELNVDEVESVSIETNNYDDETESLDIHINFKKGE